MVILMATGTHTTDMATMDERRDLQNLVLIMAIMGTGTDTLAMGTIGDRQWCIEECQTMR